MNKFWIKSLPWSRKHSMADEHNRDTSGYIYFQHHHPKCEEGEKWITWPSRLCDMYTWILGLSPSLLLGCPAPTEQLVLFTPEWGLCISISCVPFRNGTAAMAYCQNPNSTISSIQQSLRLDYILRERSTTTTHHTNSTCILKTGKSWQLPG